jgi:hypothetical protein
VARRGSEGKCNNISDSGSDFEDVEEKKKCWSLEEAKRSLKSS